jgi:hypothetical protein
MLAGSPARTIYLHSSVPQARLGQRGQHLLMVKELLPPGPGPSHALSHEGGLSGSNATCNRKAGAGRKVQRGGKKGKAGGGGTKSRGFGARAVALWAGHAGVPPSKSEPVRAWEQCTLTAQAYPYLAASMGARGAKAVRAMCQTVPKRLTGHAKAQHGPIVRRTGFLSAGSVAAPVLQRF